MKNRSLVWGLAHARPKYKLIHRPQEGLNLKCECILVSAMVHLRQGMKLWFTNKPGKVVENEKTINCLHICLLIFVY